MSVLPRQDRESEPHLRLVLANEETSDITDEMALHRRWALGHTATGQFEAAESNYADILYNLRPDDAMKLDILLERSAMREQRGWYWYAYLDLGRVVELLADYPDMEDTNGYMQAASDGQRRLGQILDELSTTWPMRSSPYI